MILTCELGESAYDQAEETCKIISVAIHLKTSGILTEALAARQLSWKNPLVSG